jgi:hypothetical protein
LRGSIVDDTEIVDEAFPIPRVGFGIFPKNPIENCFQKMDFDSELWGEL